jgi:hypothetical protein
MKDRVTLNQAEQQRLLVLNAARVADHVWWIEEIVALLG